MFGSNSREGQSSDTCRGRKATLGPDRGGLDARLRHLACPRGFNTVLSPSNVLVAGFGASLWFQLMGKGYLLASPPDVRQWWGGGSEERKVPGSSCSLCLLSSCLQSLGKCFPSQEPLEGHIIDAERHWMQTAQLT